jgi:hypothetical protein
MGGRVCAGVPRAVCVGRDRAGGLSIVTDDVKMEGRRVDGLS